MVRLAIEARVRSFSMQRPRAGNAYLNFNFESPTVAKTWRMVDTRILRHRRLGPRIRRASIVVCQGSRGWANYRLLHHFDSRKPLDALTGVAIGYAGRAGDP